MKIESGREMRKKNGWSSLGEEGQNMEIGMTDRKGIGERNQSITRNNK